MEGLRYAVLATALGKHQDARMPCPVCGPTRSTPHKQRHRTLRVWGGFGRKGELISYNCAHCGILGYLKPDGAVTPVRCATPRPPHNWAQQFKRVRALWDATTHINAVPAIRFYLSRRGIALNCPLWVHGTLALPWGRAEYPAAVCGLLSPQNTLVSLQYILLTADGHKAPVEFAKPLLKDARVIPGSAIRLAQPVGKVLGIAEGVETALAAMRLHGLPTWATTGERLLRQFVPPPGIEKVIIFGDNDSSGVGQKAAHVLATRLTAEGLKAEVRIPDRVGDWNDVLLEGAS